MKSTIPKNNNRKTYTNVLRNQTISKEEMFLSNYFNSSFFDILQALVDENIENEYQLHNRFITRVFIGTDGISLVLNFYFHYLIYRMTLRKDLKNSQGTTSKLLLCYSIFIPITALLAFIYLNIIIQYTYPPSEFFGEWFCFTFEFFVHASFTYIATFSMFTAMMKYWFIVENAKAKSFGEEKGKTAFLILHLIIPVTIAALNSISNGEKDRDYLVNICWSESISNSKTTNSSVFDEYGGMDILCSNRRYQTGYYLGETASYFLDPLLRMICGSLGIFQALFCSNLFELILYAFLYKYLKR